VCHFSLVLKVSLKYNSLSKNSTTFLANLSFLPFGLMLIAQLNKVSLIIVLMSCIISILFLYVVAYDLISFPIIICLNIL